jgi:putative endonuclease
VSAAIQCEKEIKGWTRVKKLALIEVNNPTWEDLSEQWYPQLAARQSLDKADPSLR